MVIFRSSGDESKALDKMKMLLAARTAECESLASELEQAKKHQQQESRECTEEEADGSRKTYLLKELDRLRDLVRKSSAR